MRRLPPLNALRVFEAAARQLNFSVAAAELCVTHSAVSHQMRQLESWFGRPLFIRQSSGVRLTAAGQSLLQASSQALALLESRCAEISQTEAKTEITLGAPGSFLANWLIARLGRFEAAYPAISLRLQTCDNLDELAKNHIDALIVSRREWSRGLDVTPLLAELCGPVCAPAEARQLHGPEDLAGKEVLHTRSQAGAWPEWARACGLDAMAFQYGRQFDHLSLMLEAAAAGLGIAIAPSLLVERELASGRLLAPLGFIPCGAQFALCLNRARKQEAPLAALRVWLCQEAQDETISLPQTRLRP